MYCIIDMFVVNRSVGNQISKIRTKKKRKKKDYSLFLSQEKSRTLASGLIATASLPGRLTNSSPTNHFLHC
jgi:hypothetical protein